MRTMFVSRESNAAKKKFQKPNILRRKPKGPTARPNKTEAHESPAVKSLVTTMFAQEPKTEELQLGQVSNVKCGNAGGKKPVQQLILDNNIISENIIRNQFYEVETVVDARTSLTANGNNGLINNSEESASEGLVNVELFLNDSPSSQNITTFEIDGDIVGHMKHDWCLDLINDSQEIIINSFDESQIEGVVVEQAPSETSSVVPLSTESSAQESASGDTMSSAIPVQNLTIEYLANSTMNFKCNIPDCNKRFRSEPKLKKHMSVHNPESSARPPRQITVECPVRTLAVDGNDLPCGRTFHAKHELVKHLNEDHSPEDANFICAECGRRFFWASGLRAHARAHCGRPLPLLCAWPGCGRAFRQPCRLREHTRAHTGDKPYPCRYPNCGWAFRTASKLLRHARRHTGERRHECGTCGRAFLRGEHLRDHLARQHRDKHPCDHAGCQRTFTNLEALLSHMKKAHKEDSSKQSLCSTAVADTSAPLRADPEDSFTVCLDSPALEEATAHVEIGSCTVAELVADAEDADVEWHAARTHCTWPLPPRAGSVFDTAVDGEFVLEEDVQVELSEGSESNIYTIRSDLFLHGNVLTNEDSEHLPGAGAAGAGGAGSLLVAPQPGESDLGLLDAHPTIDLMQEELMYTDAAVDESSFRVFLLSGEELG